MAKWGPLVLCLAGLAGPVQGEETWRVLDGPEIIAALTGAVLDYPTAWQDFRPSGRTLYNSGQDSWGYWAVRGDQYCSQWPPRAEWECYDMAQQGDRLRFTGARGDITVGTLRP